jgi:AP-5 complex subunit beta-1
LFDPLALKALKLDLLASCSVLRFKSDSDYNSSSRDGDEGLVDTVKVFEQGLLAVSSFKWLPPGSTEIAIAFRTFHKFLIAGSSHSDSDPSTTRNLLDSAIFRTLQVLINNIPF